MEDAVKITAVAAFLFIVLLLLHYYESAFFGQFLTHSIQRMHSVAFFRFRELSVTSTSIGHILLHFSHETHFSRLHVMRMSEK